VSSLKTPSVLTRKRIGTLKVFVKTFKVVLKKGPPEAKRFPDRSSISHLASSPNKVGVKFNVIAELTNGPTAEAFNVVLPDAHIAILEPALTLVGAGLTVTVVEAHAALHWTPSKFLAKYVVVVVGLTVVGLPVAIHPEVLHPEVNQCTVPEAPLAVKVIGAKALSQSVLALAVIEVGLGGAGATQAIFKAKPGAITLPSDVNLTVNGPVVDVIVGIV
jgi:hypothetical protein